MMTALSGKPPQYFDIPDDVVQVRMDLKSGKRATDDTPDAVSALFRKGTQPR